MYRINRRPRSQATLFGAQREPFIDHLVECLLFGEATVTGRAHLRTWTLGNRTIDPQQTYLAGFVGYEVDETRGIDRYDHDQKSWIEDTAVGERTARSPFVVVAESRRLLVYKHPTFSEAVIPQVFETLLNRGEDERETGGSTEWSVEPLLDTTGFDEWLGTLRTLDALRFKVKLPNPDAEEAFAEIDSHLREMDAEELTHELKPRDAERGLSKDLTKDRISRGLLEMATRSFARIVAKGRDRNGRSTEYNQLNRVRRTRVDGPETFDEGLQQVVAFAVTMPPELASAADLPSSEGGTDGRTAKKRRVSRRGR